ncbi:MAG: alpha-hydroxy-acid oxidizing protein, partial [Desulfovibrionales bacterium]
MQEIRAKARELMQGFCRVCPVCNGKACAGEVPGMGGIGTGASFTANVESLSRIKLNMRLIHDAVEPNPSVSLLGKTLDIPVLAAPIGGVSFNMGGKISEEEYVQAVLGGCADKGTLGCTGDGVPAFIHETAFSAIKETNGKGIPFIKPWEDDEFFTKLEKALDTGTKILGMDI